MGVSVATPGRFFESDSMISLNATDTAVPASSSGLSLTLMEIWRELPVSSPLDIPLSSSSLPSASPPRTNR
jgi:hypothetical protein